MYLALAIMGALLGLPPVTQEEAVEFHTSGRCQMMDPGNGITRADGDGWIVSKFPGRVTVDTGIQTVELDAASGKAYKIHIKPGYQPSWCLQVYPNGRDACGPVPKGFLYNAVKVGDPNVIGR